MWLYCHDVRGGGGCGCIVMCDKCFVLLFPPLHDCMGELTALILRVQFHIALHSKCVSKTTW